MTKPRSRHAETRHFGQRAGDQSAGAGFRGRDRQFLALAKCRAASRAASTMSSSSIGRCSRQPDGGGRIGGDAFAAAGEAEPLAGRRLHADAVDARCRRSARCARAWRRDAGRSSAPRRRSCASRCAMRAAARLHALDRECAGNDRTTRRAIADRRAGNARRYRRRRARRGWRRPAHAARRRRRNGPTARGHAQCERRRA